MINTGTFLKIADNSGAILGLCISTLRQAKQTGALPGHVLVVNIKKNIFKKHIIKKSLIIIKGKIYKALVIRSNRGVKRWGGFKIIGGINAIVLLNQYKAPYATRIIGVVFREIRLLPAFRQIISLAETSI